MTNTKHSDWRLSYTITKDNYDEVKKNFSADAIVYDIPIGTKYEDYEQKRSSYSKSYHESLSIDQAFTLLHTGLDAFSVDAYKACLDKEIFTSSGIHAKVTLEDEDSIGIYVKVSAPGAPPRGDIRWRPQAIAGSRIESHVENPSAMSISVPRPKKNVVLVGNYGAYTTEQPMHLSAHTLPQPEKAKFDPQQPLYECKTLGHQGDVAMDLGYLGATNLIIGYTVQKKHSDRDTQIFRGTTKGSNEALVTTHPGAFQGGSVTPIGFLLKDDPHVPGSQLLYVVTGYPPNTKDQNIINLCTATDGKVTTSSTQGGCTTDPVGYTYSVQ